MHDSNDLNISCNNNNFYYNSIIKVQKYADSSYLKTETKADKNQYT